MTDFAKAGGTEKRGEGAIIPFSFFFVCPFTVYASVCGGQICAQPHGAVYTVG